MARPLRKNLMWVMLLVVLAIAEATTPPGIANNPSHARCLIKKYKMCYNLEHVCPKFCPNGCTVECVSCKPICTDGSTAPPPPEESTPPPPEESTPPPPEESTLTPPPSPPQHPPPHSTPTPTPSPPPEESTPPPSPPQYSPPPPTPTPTPSPPPLTPTSPTPSFPPPSTPTPTPVPSSPPPSPPQYSPPPPNQTPTPIPSPPQSPPPPTPTTPTPSPPQSPPPATPTTPSTSPPQSPPPPTPATPMPSPPQSPPPTIPTTPAPSPPQSPPPTTPTTPSSSPPQSPPPAIPTTPSPSPPQSPPPLTPATPTPSPSQSPPPTIPTTPTPSTPQSPPPTTPTTPTPTPTPYPPHSPPPTTPTTPTPSPTPSTPTSPPQSPPTPVTPTPSNPPPSPPNTDTPPSTPPTSPPTGTIPPPTSTPPSSPVPVPPTTPSSPPIPPSNSPPPPTDSSSDAAAGRRKRCRDRNYPQCYGVQHTCPSSCPHTCQVDCVTCKPVCNCDMPGAVCQDPRFIGGDGLTFYFHGKKDQDFCLVTEPNLQINAHFIGKRNENMKRDFTWVQSIAILIGNHHLFIGARKTATWNDAVDRLALSFDGEPITLSVSESATWQPQTLPSTTIKRDGGANAVTIEINGVFKISAKVVPITEHESKVHNYGITKDDCFAHLELGFKFFSFSGAVDGVLGQTYRNDYVSRVKMGSTMPVLGGESNYAVSNIFATDCAVSKFHGGEFLAGNEVSNLELPSSMKCGSWSDGTGVVCKR